MNESKFFRRFLFVLTFVVAGFPLLAQDDSESQDRGPKLYGAQLVRAVDLAGGLGSLGAAGKDPLRDGVVEVRGKRAVEVRLNGAAPGTTYELFYCGFPGTSCISLGKLDTKDNGNAAKVFDFKGDGNGWAGIFYLAGGTEGGATVQYVGGWIFDPTPSTGTAAGSQDPSRVSVKGAITSLDATAQTFNIENFSHVIVVTSDTRFQGHRDFSEMQPGQVVEVDGYLSSDGKINAVSIKYDKPSNNLSDPPGKPESPGKPDDKPGKGKG